MAAVFRQKADAGPVKSGYTAGAAQQTERISMAKRTEPSPSKAAPSARRARRPAASAVVVETAEESPQAAVAPHPPSATDEEVPQNLLAVFGGNLRAARLKGGLKQSDLAERLGFAQSRIALIESGHQNLTLKTMMRLAEVVGHNVSDMLLKPKLHRRRS